MKNRKLKAKIGLGWPILKNMLEAFKTFSYIKPRV